LLSELVRDEYITTPNSRHLNLGSQVVKVACRKIRQTLCPIEFLTNLVEDLRVNLQRVASYAANKVVDRRVLRR